MKKLIEKLPTPIEGKKYHPQIAILDILRKQNEIIDYLADANLLDKVDALNNRLGSSELKNKMCKPIPEILPCPFCKSIRVSTEANERGVWVECTRCNSSGPIKDNEFEAWAVWNEVKR